MLKREQPRAYCVIIAPWPAQRHSLASPLCQRIATAWSANGFPANQCKNDPVGHGKTAGGFRCPAVAHIQPWRERVQNRRHDPKNWRVPKQAILQLQLTVTVPCAPVVRIRLCHCDFPGQHAAQLVGGRPDSARPMALKSTLVPSTKKENPAWARCLYIENTPTIRRSAVSFANHIGQNQIVAQPVYGADDLRGSRTCANGTVGGWCRLNYCSKSASSVTRFSPTTFSGTQPSTVALGTERNS